MKEEEIRNLWSTALDEETERRYGMQKHHPPEDCPQWFVNEFSKIANQSVIPDNTTSLQK